MSVVDELTNGADVSTTTVASQKSGVLSIAVARMSGCEAPRRDRESRRYIIRNAMTYPGF